MLPSDGVKEAPPVRALVIVNRRARRLAQEGPLLREIRKPRDGIEIVETSSRAELGPIFRDLRRQATLPVVVLAGGDGSHMTGLTALAEVFQSDPLPPVALAPGGTVGTVARNWGVRGDPATYLSRLLDRLSVGTVVSEQRPTLRIREGSGTERTGFIFGAGLVARFFGLYEAAGANGNRAAAKIVARIFVGSFTGSRYARGVLDPVPCALDVDGVPSPFDRVSLLCASVVPNLGLGMRLTYRAGRTLDRFHVVGTALGPRQLGPQMPLVLAGRPLLGPRVDELARRLELRFPTSQGAYVLDGDLFQADEIAVTAGPAIELVV